MRELVLRPKFHIGDIVYYLWLNKVESSKVQRIIATIDDRGVKYEYCLQNVVMHRTDEDTYASKQELLDSL